MTLDPLVVLNPMFNVWHWWNPKCGTLIAIGVVILLKEVVVFKPNPDKL